MFLTSEQQRQVQLSVVEYIRKASEFYSRPFVTPVVRFDLRGKCGGIAMYDSWVIRVNQTLCAENFEHYIKQVVGHEVAHLIAHKVYGRNIKPHGYEWKSVMVKAFKLTPDRCHEYNTTNSVARHVTKHPFSCKCRTHMFSSIRAKRYAEGARYRCKVCYSPIHPGTVLGAVPANLPPARAPQVRRRMIVGSNLHELLGLKF